MTYKIAFTLLRFRQKVRSFDQSLKLKHVFVEL